VSRVDADLSQDPHSGAQYYIVRVAIDETEIGNLKGLKLVPGMPVEAFIQTGKRSVLSYVINRSRIRWRGPSRKAEPDRS
jgi:HlyD family secretion protein